MLRADWPPCCKMVHVSDVHFQQALGFLCAHSADQLHEEQVMAFRPGDAHIN